MRGTTTRRLAFRRHERLRRSFARAGVCAWALLLVLALGGCSKPRRYGTAITNVTAIDAVHGVRPGVTVWFHDDRIIAVGPTNELHHQAVRVIDGTGEYLIPGLWDMHVHLTHDDAFTESMPRLFLYYGVTSVRDTGGLMSKLGPVVERARAPGAVAPRIFYSGPLLDGAPVVYDGQELPELGVSVTTPEAAEATVAELEAGGVDFIKIYEIVSPSVFSALVKAARTRELPIAAHVPLSMLASDAGPQVDSLEHLRNIELDCTSDPQGLLEKRRRMLASSEATNGGELRTRIHHEQHEVAVANYDEARCARTIASLRSTLQVPTLRLVSYPMRACYDHPDWDEALGHVPPARQQQWRSSTDAWRSRTEDSDPPLARWRMGLATKMHQAGVPMAAGTDTPLAFALPGFSLHTELERLVEIGMTPLEALGAATIRPAEFFSLEDTAGVIAVGMQADLVLLRADPMQDISNTRRIIGVITKGRYFARRELSLTPSSSEH